MLQHLEAVSGVVSYFQNNFLNYFEYEDLIAFLGDWCC